MSNNLHRVQNIFISTGGTLPSNDAVITAVTDGQVGVYGADMKALNPAGADTISTQPYIYVVQGKTDANGTFAVKRSQKINGASIISCQGKPYEAAKREVWSIGYNRKTATGSITAANNTEYKFSLLFKNDKSLYSERPERFAVQFTSAASATQTSIATQIANSINNSSFSKYVTAIVVGDGSGVYGMTTPTNVGVEITSKDINQNLSTTYFPQKVYFSAAVDRATGFGTSTSCTQIQAFDPGNGTYEQVFAAENFDFGYEGVINRYEWPIPALAYSASSTLVPSAAIGVNATGTATQDTLVMASTIAAILKPGDKLDISGNAYEIKYIAGDGTGTSGNPIVLTSPLLTSPAGTDVVKLKVKYDLITIEFNDSINGPTGNVAVANKSVVIASPALDSGDAYNGTSGSSGDLVALLNAYIASVPQALPNISI